MKETKWKVFVQQNWATDGINMFMFCRDFDGSGAEVVRVVTDLVVTQQPASMEITNASPLFLSMDNAEELMDQLWNAGIRPTGSRNQTDISNAKNDHIKDLEKVLDAFIKISTGVK